MNRLELTPEESLALAKMEAEAPFVGAGTHLAKADLDPSNKIEADTKKSDLPRVNVASAA